LEVNFLSEVIVFSCVLIVVTAKGSVVLSQLCILIPDAGELFLGVLESKLLGSKIVAADVNEFLGVSNASQSPVVLVVKLLELVLLVVGLMGFGLVGVFEMGDFTVHLCTLYLHGLNLALQISLVTALVSTLVSFCNCILPKTASLKVLFVKEALSASIFVVKAEIQF
jgi:hypothetical protein